MLSTILCQDYQASLDSIHLNSNMVYAGPSAF